MNHRNSKVFLSYAHADKHVADHIKEVLLKNNLNVFSDRDVEAGKDWEEEIQYVMQNSDFLFILLSPKLFKRDGMEFEFSDELFTTAKKRNIHLFPIMIEPCDIPNRFNEFELFDLTGSTSNESILEDIIQRIQTLNLISFDKFTPARFEELVHDLLTNLNFKNVKKQNKNFASDIDFIAEFYSVNPFKIKEREVWSIESKFYKESRFDIQSLKKIVDQYKYVPRSDAKLLLITNSTLNSVAEKFLTDIKDSSFLDIVFIDGFQLKNVIAKEKSIIEKYFAT